MLTNSSNDLTISCHFESFWPAVRPVKYYKSNPEALLVERQSKLKAAAVKRRSSFLPKCEGLTVDIRQKDLNDSELNEVNDRLDRFFREYDFIRQVQLMAEGWRFAFDIARTTNIEPGDILHLATALGEKCDLLITEDSPFIKEAKRFLRANKYALRIVKSKEAEKLIVQDDPR